MFGVECFDTHDEPISHYTQWDINQTLKIVLYGMDDGYMKNAPYVHFANIKSSEALVVSSTLQGDDTVLVDIPNQLLQEPYPLLIYVYLNDSSDASSQRTIVKIEIPVHKRARPSDYEYVENIDRITAEVIKQEIYDDFMDEIRGGTIAYPYVTLIDESTGKHVNLKVSDEKFGLYVDSTNRQLLDTGDIVNNLMTDSSTKVLSASMGAAIRNMVDVIPNDIDEKIEEHDSSPTSHSDIRDDISSVSSAVDAMQNSIAEIENKIGDVSFMLDDTISGSGILTTTDTLVNYSPVEMRIKGNTIQNLWVNPIATKNGITISNADDGAITINGSATATTTVTTDKIYTMKAGVTYSIGADKLTPVNGFVFSVHQYSSEDRLLAGSDSITYASKGRTITTNAQMAYVKFVVAIPSGASVSETYHIMLNVGEELEPWCAPGLNSIDEVSIVTAGKNLMIRRSDLAQVASNGITFTPNEDGSITVNGTATDIAYYNIDFKAGIDTAINIIPQGETYALSGNSTHCAVVCDYYTSEGSRKDFLVTNGTSSGVLPSEAKKLRSYLQVNTGSVVNNEVVYPQLELGSTATAYEPPTITTTPLPEVELRGLPNGTCDELVIKGDGTCEVERRTAKIVLNGSEEQAIGSPITATHGGFYFNIVFDMPDNVDGITFSSASQVSDKLQIGNGDAFPNAVGVFANGSTHKTDARISVDGIETAEALRTYLQSNPITLVYTIKDDSTEPQSSVTLPSFPSDKSNIYATSNVPTAGLTVRYWKKSGELVANLYKLLWSAQRETL